MQICSAHDFFQLVIENENVLESQKIPVRFKNDDLLNRDCIQLKFSSNFVMNSDFHKFRVLFYERRYLN